MKRASRTRFVRHLLLFALASNGVALYAQVAPQQPSSATVSALDDTQKAALQKAMDAHDYIAAEKLLLAEIARETANDAHSRRAAALLALIGNVYFLNHDDLHAAVAWKKSEAIASLDPKESFSLAMAYVRLQHPEWARDVLVSLAKENDKEALYPYWLGRIDYDGHQYSDAIGHFKKAIALNPEMARAYDSLGLCYYYSNDNDSAVAAYRKAIELDRVAAHPSAWPYLNLAITLQFLHRLPEAETNVREALRLDPKLAQAHYTLGSVLEDSGHSDDAIAEYQQAVNVDAAYAEPHMALARIFHKQGKEIEAREQVAEFTRLRGKPNATTATPVEH